MSDRANRDACSRNIPVKPRLSGSVSEAQGWHQPCFAKILPGLALVAAAFVQSSCAPASMGQPARAGRPLPTTTDIFLLMGQSNMSGRGNLDELNRAERNLDPSIMLAAPDGSLVTAVEPLDADPDGLVRVSEDRAAAVGPGLFFARQVNAPGRQIVLVPCAKGGTSIQQWHSLDPSALLGSCVERARRLNGRVAGALWYQGESDTQTQAQATQWPKHFSIMVDRLRRALQTPNFSVVMVSISDPPVAPISARYPAWVFLKKLQAKIVMRCVATTTAEGLPRAVDQLHLTTEGQRRLGRRIADAYLQLTRDSNNARCT